MERKYLKFFKKTPSFALFLSTHYIGIWMLLKVFLKRKQNHDMEVTITRNKCICRLKNLHSRKWIFRMFLSVINVDCIVITKILTCSDYLEWGIYMLIIFKKSLTYQIFYISQIVFEEEKYYYS